MHISQVRLDEPVTVACMMGDDGRPKQQTK